MTNTTRPVFGPPKRPIPTGFINALNKLSLEERRQRAEDSGVIVAANKSGIVTSDQPYIAPLVRPYIAG